MSSLQFLKESQRPLPPVLGPEWPRVSPGVRCSPCSPAWLWLMNLHGMQIQLWAMLTHVELLIMIILRRQFSTRQNFLTTCWAPLLKKNDLLRHNWHTVITPYFFMCLLILTSLSVLVPFQFIFLLNVDHTLLLLCMPGNLWLNARHCPFYLVVIGDFYNP